MVRETEMNIEDERQTFSKLLPRSWNYNFENISGKDKWSFIVNVTCRPFLCFCNYISSTKLGRQMMM